MVMKKLVFGLTLVLMMFLTSCAFALTALGNFGNDRTTMNSAGIQETGRWNVSQMNDPGKFCAIGYHTFPDAAEFGVVWEDHGIQTVPSKEGRYTYLFFPHVNGADYYSHGFITMEFQPSGTKYTFKVGKDAFRWARAGIVAFDDAKNSIFLKLQTETSLRIQFSQTFNRPVVEMNINLMNDTPNFLSDFVFCKIGKDGSSDEDTDEKE